MATDRTIVTELATALGTLPFPTVAAALAARPSELRIPPTAWGQLSELHDGGRFTRDFDIAFANGRAFGEASDALAGRPPRIIEWTGGRKPSGDEVAPIDLRIDHVYMVSCKYLSANVANASPARLFQGLLATAGSWKSTDWFHAVAPDEYQTLYESHLSAVQADGFPARAQDLSPTERRRLRGLIRATDRDDDGVREAYARLTEAVAAESAAQWRTNLSAIKPAAMLWRLLRIGNAPYFLLGAHGPGSSRLRIATTWDWADAFELRNLSIEAVAAGQPKVEWLASYRLKGGPADVRSVRGHVEIRWSHGPFGNPPEAKVYLDTAIEQVPGYFDLGSAPPQTLFTS